MERRKFIIGAGSLAAVGAAAMGSGAFSAMSADREATIDVVNDADGLLALEDDHPSDVVRGTADGELVIDFTAGEQYGAEGVNVDSRYEVGETDLSDDDPETGPQGNPAFFIRNQDTSTHTVTLEYTLDDVEAASNLDSWLKFQTETLDDQKFGVEIGNGPDFTATSDEASGTLDPGERTGVSIIVVTGESTVDDLSGTLTVSAE